MQNCVAFSEYMNFTTLEYLLPGIAVLVALTVPIQLGSWLAWINEIKSIWNHFYMDNAYKFGIHGFSIQCSNLQDKPQL